MKKAFIQLHIAVLLAGFTGILGRLITLNEGLLVWYRLLLTSISLWILAFARRRFAGSRRRPDQPVRQDQPAGQDQPGGRYRLSGKDILRIFGVGAIAALHWVTFYGSIKYSNVSVALVCFSAIGFFTALVEPLIFRHRVDRVELLLGLMVIAGIFFIFRVDPHYKTGILVGLISSLLGSLFPVLNRSILQKIPAGIVTRYELSGGFLFLTALMPLYLHFFPTDHLIPGATDWAWLLVLSWICTVLAFSLSMHALQKISAFTVNLSYNLEPVYGILLAFAVFREDKWLGGGFYIGLFWILLAIGLQMGRLWVRRPAR